MNEHKIFLVWKLESPCKRQQGKRADRLFMTYVYKRKRKIGQIK